MPVRNENRTDNRQRLDEIMVPYLKSIQTAPPETTGA